MRLGTTQRRHTQGVAGIDFTRDGTAAVTAQATALSGSGTPTADGWSAPSTCWPAPRLRISCSGISPSAPDGQLMAAAGFVFDPARRRMVHRVWIWDLKPRPAAARDRCADRRSVLPGLLARRRDARHGRLSRATSSSGTSRPVIAGRRSSSAIPPIDPSRSHRTARSSRPASKERARGSGTWSRPRDISRRPAVQLRSRRSSRPTAG